MHNQAITIVEMDFTFEDSNTSATAVDNQC